MEATVRGRLLLGAVVLLVLGLAASTAELSRAQTLPTATATPSAGDQTVETMEARVISATAPAPCTPQTGGGELGPEEQRCQSVELLFTNGSLADHTVTIEEGRVPVGSRAGVVYKAGDRVIVDRTVTEGQPDTYHIIDFVRTEGLLLLAIAFVVLALIFGRLRGLTSLIGLAVSFAILMFFMIPRIIAGDDPIVITVFGSALIMVATLYLSHGFNVKTTAAIAGTSIALLITGALAWFVVEGLRLTGFGSDDAVNVQIAYGGTINLKGILLGSIIIGSLGVLDDLTISQSAIVFELRSVDPSLKWQRLFRHAINIGRDHIAATVNTLVLAYAGASLPLLILFATFVEPWSRVINQEVIAEEVVRTLVGSIGLMASVPITTWIAALWASRRPPSPHDHESGDDLHARVHGHAH